MAMVYTVGEPTVAPIVPLQSHGNHRVRVVHLTSDGGAYTSGGDAVTAAAVGLTRVEYGDCTVHTQGATANVATAATILPQADGSLKVKLFAAATGAEFAATAGAGLILQCRLYGKN